MYYLYLNHLKDETPPLVLNFGILGVEPVAHLLLDHGHLRRMHRRRCAERCLSLASQDEQEGARVARKACNARWNEITRVLFCFVLLVVPW